MKAVLVVLIGLCAAACIHCSQANHVLHRVKRLINGQNSRPRQWPWNISLQKDGLHICGGSLITKEWIITAAHCVQRTLQPGRYSVTVGVHRLYTGHSGVKFFVKEIHNHSLFHNSHKRYDIALLLLDGWVRTTPSVRPIQLPSQGHRVPLGKICYLTVCSSVCCNTTGWGDTEPNGQHSDILQQAAMMIVGYSQCRAINGNTVHDASMICAGSRGQAGCHGDSGGPLACYERGRWILRGVVSWGNESCLAEYYTVFTRVSSLIDWIYRTQNTECRRYRTLNTPDRAQGLLDSQTRYCDRNFITTGWYRFAGHAGYKMATSCVPEKHCGTDAPGWVEGDHPDTSEGVVTRKVYYSWNGHCKKWNNTIHVRNCGTFYVYRLTRPPGCNLRYCGNGKSRAVECHNYRILDSLDRARSQPTSTWQCDSDDLDNSWYRFSGLAGDGIANSCVPSNHCGTIATGWMLGSHPTQVQGVVKRQVCFSYENDCCFLLNWISVRNCGGFYVYKLHKPPGCSMRYCGNGKGSSCVTALSSALCKNYHVLSSADRSRKYWRRHVRKRCDRNDVINGRWYRFVKNAGLRIATSCVPGHRCATHATGWMTGRHPSITEGVVVRRVCYSFDGQCCRWSNKIRVKNCGEFYIYQLYRPVGCHLRYCGNGQAASIHARSSVGFGATNRRTLSTT